MVDLLEGAPDLVAFGAVDAQVQRVVEHDRELTRVAAASAHTTGVGAGLVVLCTGMAMWAALALGVSAVHAGRLDGVFLAVVALIPLAAFELVSPLPVAAQALEGAQRSAARLSAVLDQPELVIEPSVAKATRPGPHHDLRVRGLRVRHVPDAPWAVDGVDLDLSEGRRVALVGASGAGKSTIATALVRFVDYESGSVRLDGTELRDCGGDQVREIVGLVEQDAHIFDSTLRENMRLAQPTASDAEITAALAARPAVRLGDEPASRPRHGGRRARLFAVRRPTPAPGSRPRLLADFPILVLDEPGEHLDAETADAADARPSVGDDRSHHAADHSSPRRARVGRRDRGARPRSRSVDRTVPSMTAPPMRGVA